jgi:hypothetical protein
LGFSSVSAFNVSFACERPTFEPAVVTKGRNYEGIDRKLVPDTRGDKAQTLNPTQWPRQNQRVERNKQ